ncbi:MAG: 5-formyltetrahydrofolate cyclo-ligase [Eubacterium sp.]|nr:5-formyltetrahydrofolate cyclo-ligase [Eubacterium sp.]
MYVKSELRKHFRQKRKNISDKNNKDFLICQTILSSDLFIDASQILCYYPLDDEINTLPVIDAALKCGKKTALPYCMDDNGNMEFYYITSRNDLKTGSFGIMEPDLSVCEKVCDFSSSLCIVPAFSFDRNGFRLGYGKGYYDRFLKKFTFNSIGLCYNNFLSDSLPVDHFDVAVKYIATEDKITLCKEDK